MGSVLSRSELDPFLYIWYHTVRTQSGLSPLWRDVVMAVKRCSYIASPSLLHQATSSHHHAIDCFAHALFITLHLSQRTCTVAPWRHRHCIIVSASSHHWADVIALSRRHSVKLKPQWCDCTIVNYVDLSGFHTISYMYRVYEMTCNSQYAMMCRAFILVVMLTLN